MSDPIQLNAAAEAVAGPIRESLRAAEKIRTLRFADSETELPTSEIPSKASRAGKILGFDEDGAPIVRSAVIDTIEVGDDATGDVYYRDAEGDLARLPVGSAGQVLALVAGVPAWVTPSGGGAITDLDLGFGAVGDMYYRNSEGVMVRLATGLSGQVIKLSSGIPVWADEAGAGGGGDEVDLDDINLGTGASNDLFRRGDDANLVRIPVGTNGQVFAVDAMGMGWKNPVYVTPPGRYEYGEGITTNATPVRFNFDGITTVTTENTLVLSNYQLVRFRGTILASTEAGVCFSSEFTGGLKRVANAASTALVGTPAYAVASDSGASAWDAVITADTTRGGLALTVTGAASTTIRWQARIDIISRVIYNPFW